MGMGAELMKKLSESCKKLNRNHRILICAAFAATLIVCGVSVKPTLAYFTTYATAKGGISVAIHSELGIPVNYIGVGETIEDLQKFDSNQFVNALFEVGEEKSGC